MLLDDWGTIHAREIAETKLVAAVVCMRHELISEKLQIDLTLISRKIKKHEFNFSIVH